MDDEVRSTIQKRDASGTVRHGAEWLALWSDPGSMQTREERLAGRARDRARAATLLRAAAAARAVAGDPTLSVPLGAGREGPEAALRGDADLLALAARHHDAALHAALVEALGADPGEARLLAMLEEVRVGALGARRFPGTLPNLVAQQEERLARLDLDAAHLASLVPLSEALRMAARDAMAGLAAPSVDTAGLRMWDAWLRARVAGPLAALGPAAADQRAFAGAALALIRATLRALEGRAEGPPRRTPTPSGGSEGDGEGEGRSPDAEEDGPGTAPGTRVFADEDGPAPRLPQAPAAPILPYRAWTTAHDRVLRAAELGAAADLRAARARLEERRASERRALAPLVTGLQRRLMALQRRAWTFDLEEGLVDAARLDRVVVNPGVSDIYKAEAESRFRGSAVTLLIDNSGSMRGKPVEIACLAADMVAAALERCAIPCEVLGFTTADWKGGLPRKEWVRAGRPPDPGRLNALRHIVYKAHDEPLRHARDALAVMLTEGLLKENVDGEALAWAARRLAARPEPRRVLIVLSDGAPVDQATLEENADPRLLDRHLRETVAAIGRAGQVQLAAIGIRHDVGSHYPHAVRIDRIEDLGRALVGLLDALVAR